MDLFQFGYGFSLSRLYHRTNYFIQVWQETGFPLVPDSSASDFLNDIRNLYTDQVWRSNLSCLIHSLVITKLAHKQKVEKELPNM